MHQWQIHIKYIGNWQNVEWMFEHRATMHEKLFHQIQNVKLHQWFKRFYCQFYEKLHWLNWLWWKVYPCKREIKMNRQLDVGVLHTLTRLYQFENWMINCFN